MDTTTSLLLGMLAGVMAAQGVTMLAAQREGWGNRKPGQGQLNTAMMGCYRGVSFENLPTRFPQLKDLKSAPVEKACNNGKQKYLADANRVIEEKLQGKKCGQHGACDAAWLSAMRPCNHSGGKMCCNYLGVKDSTRTCVDKNFAGVPASTTLDSFAERAKQLAAHSSKLSQALAEARRKPPAADNKPAANKRAPLNPSLEEWQRQQQEAAKRKDTVWQEKKKKYPERWLPAPGVRLGNINKTPNLHYMCDEGDFVDWIQFFHSGQGMNSIKMRCRSADGKRFKGHTEKYGTDAGTMKQLDNGGAGLNNIRVAYDNHLVRGLEVSNTVNKRTTGFGGDASAPTVTHQCPAGTVITGVSGSTGKWVDSLAFRCGPVRAG